jgi:hypothetical protein
VFWRDVEASDVQEDGGLSTTVFVDAASDAMVCERLGGGGGTAGGAITVRFADGEGWLPFEKVGESAPLLLSTFGRAPVVKPDHACLKGATRTAQPTHTENPCNSICHEGNKLCSNVIPSTAQCIVYDARSLAWCRVVGHESCVFELAVSGQQLCCSPLLARHEGLCQPSS